MEDVEDEEYTAPGELTLVVRRALSVQVKEDEAVQQENIFRSMCYRCTASSSFICTL